MTYTRRGDKGQRDAARDDSEGATLERMSSACRHARKMGAAARALLALPRSAGFLKTWAMPCRKPNTRAKTTLPSPRPRRRRDGGAAATMPKSVTGRGATPQQGFANVKLPLHTERRDSQQRGQDSCIDWIIISRCVADDYNNQP